MSGRILIIGDPHFKISNIAETAAMAEAIYSLLTNNPVTAIVVSGDTLDRHETIHVSPLTRAVKFLQQLATFAPVYLLIGNHDLKNNQQFFSTEHPFYSLKNWQASITVVDSAIIDFVGGRKCAFVPYVPPGRFAEALSTIDHTDVFCTFAHQEFRGFKMGAIESVEGDVWPPENNLVISGHIHDYQRSENVIYVGTPIQHGFGDNVAKTVSFLSLETKDEERVSLGLPVKTLVHLSVNEIATYSPPSFLEASLKIIVEGTAAEIKGARKHPHLLSWQNQGAKVIFRTLSSALPTSDFVPGGSLPTYSSLLHRSLKDNPSVLRLYEELFGTS